jgi:uncharacterized membrane protein
MKIFIKIILISIIGYGLQLFLPWWYVVVASFFINFIIYSKGWQSFMAGFWGIFLLWFIAALVIDVKSHSILSDKVAQIFQLPNPMVLILATALIGGISGGFSGLTASLLLNIFRKKRSDYYYS